MEPLFKLYYNPTAGYLPGIRNGEEPGCLDGAEKKYLRDLAQKVSELAGEQKQAQKRELWYKHIRLEKVRPMILVFPEDSWAEIIRIDQLKLKDPFWMQYEWYLKHLIYRSANFNDDFVVEPDLYVSSILRYTRGYGLDVKYTKTEGPGSYVWDPPVKKESDLGKMTYPVMEVDEKLTRKRFDAASEIFGDIFKVKPHAGMQLFVNLIGEASAYRGMMQLMLDMYDRPEWLHEFMDFFLQAEIQKYKFLEENNLLTLNNRNHYTDTGGIGYTNELPGPDYDEKAVRLNNLWGVGVAQELSEVSPEHHEEFCLNYQMQILKKFGLISYGCCEPLTRKFDMLFKIPNLRRLSISPWCDIKVAADKLKNNYIYSWKPNPAMLIENFDKDLIRSYIRNFLAVTKDNVVEIILKDLVTIKNEPERIKIWIDIVRDEIERSWGRSC